MPKQLSPEQNDALRELINIGVGRASGMLSQLVNTHIQLQVPDVAALDMDEYFRRLEVMLAEKLAIVRLGFEGAFSGMARLVFPVDSANNLVAVISGEDADTPDLDSVKTAALTEVGNIVLNGVMGSFANILKQQLSFHLPAYSDDGSDVLRKPDGDGAGHLRVFAQVHFTMKQLEVVGDIILLFEVGSFDSLLKHLDDLLAEQMA